jgi:hypothetical protein
MNNQMTADEYVWLQAYLAECRRCKHTYSGGDFERIEDHCTNADKLLEKFRNKFHSKELAKEETKEVVKNLSTLRKPPRPRVFLKLA